MAEVGSLAQLMRLYKVEGTKHGGGVINPPIQSDGERGAEYRDWRKEGGEQGLPWRKEETVCNGEGCVRGRRQRTREKATREGRRSPHKGKPLQLNWELVTNTLNFERMRFNASHLPLSPIALRS